MVKIWILKKNKALTGIETAEAGTSLLEVMIALVLTLLIVESLLPLMLVGTKGIGLAGQRTTACTYADSLLEELKVRPELLSGLTEDVDVGAAELPFSVPIPSGVEAYICWVPLDGLRSLCEVRVKVVSTRGSRQWEEDLVGIVLTPTEQE